MREFHSQELSAGLRDLNVDVLNFFFFFFAISKDIIFAR